MEIKKWVHKAPSVPHSLLNDAMNIAVEFYKEHIGEMSPMGKSDPLNTGCCCVAT